MLYLCLGLIASWLYEEPLNDFNKIDGRLLPWLGIIKMLKWINLGVRLFLSPIK